jgi:RNA polymerase sigma-70 factor (ECF subfamily)
VSRTAAVAEHTLDDIESHRRELTAFCYRMLASGAESEDAVQETMVRAWRNLDGFEGRSSLRSWLYRIATNVCIDMRRGRRAWPMDFGPASSAEATLPARLPDSAFVQPVPDARVLPDGDPADVAVARDSIRLAFVAALQYLPPRQRVVLILREVLRWQAAEVAELLDTTVASVNSALQRARATLTASGMDTRRPAPVDEDHRDLLDRYVDAFERYDISSLVALLHADATFSMPPYPMWLQGVRDIGAWYVGQGIGCKGGRLVATAANGCAAFGTYKVAGPGRWEPFNVHVVEVRDGRISAIHHFLTPALFPAFGLPPFLDERGAPANDADSPASQSGRIGTAGP